MPTEYQIQEYRDNQLSNHQLTLFDDKEDLVKCDGCLDFSVTTRFKMHDLFNGDEMNYCQECIDEYKKGFL